MERPIRKRNRLLEYDYSQNGAYFVTICTVEKKPLFWDTVGAAISRPQIENEDTVLKLPLSQYGRMAEQGILNIPRYYPAVSVEKYCVMPDHLHMILLFSEESGRLIAAPTLSRVIGQMKRWVSKQCGAGIWQKSFFEHVVRNSMEYEELWRYIHENPLKYLWKKEESK